MAFFIAVVPEGLQDNSELIRLFSKFKRTMDDKNKEVRWVQPSLWHLTLQYLGPLENLKRQELIETFEAWVPPESSRDIVLRVHGVGAFPQTDQARVLWLGIQKNQALLDAQVAVRESFKDFTENADDREYNPHITLARFRNMRDTSDLVQLGGRKHFGDYKVAEFVLMESVLQGHMMKYVPAAHKVLGAE